MNETKKKSNETTAKSITEKLQAVEEQNNKKASAEDKRLYTRFVKQIDKAYSNMEKSYLDTALALHSIYTKKLYKIDNFKNIYEFAEEKYNIKKTTCNGFIGICERFGLPNDNGTMIELQEKYKEYTSSQLMVMVAFPDILLEKCDKSMSVRKLKDIFKEYKQGLEDAEEQLKEIETTAEEVETTENEALNKPEPLDIDKDCTDVFVAEANSFEELLNMEEIISDTLEDIREGNGKKKARIEVRIVF